MTGLPDPYVAMNAVGMLATPDSTVNPFAFSACCNSADDFVSSSPVSAHGWAAAAPPPFHRLIYPAAYVAEIRPN